MKGGLYNMTKIISISLTDEEKGYLEDMELSPTALLKIKIQENMLGSLSLRRTIDKYEANITGLQNRIKILYDFIEKNKLFESFSVFEQEKNVLEKETA